MARLVEGTALQVWGSRVRFPILSFRLHYGPGIDLVSGRLRLQITGHSAHEGGKVVTPTHRPSLPPEISWYSFLDAESTPGTWTCRMFRKKSQVTRQGSIPGPSD